jgi:methionine-rich copper-binding protein CopC
LAISLLADSARAHPKLTSASPAADVSSKVSPTEIKLNFSEGVIANFLGIELEDLTKPFAPAQLVTAVSQLLNGRSPTA